MSLEDAMCTQRAIRRLKPDPVDDALVLHLIELALKAPTGSNAQNWEFIVVKDAAVKARLGRLNRQAWSLYGGIGRRLVERSGNTAMAKIIQRGTMASRPLRGDPGDRRGLPQRRHSAVATCGGGRRVRIDLPFGAEPVARRARRGTWCGTDHSSLVEQVPGATGARSPLECQPVRRHSARLAERQVRPNQATSRWRGRLTRPLRQPSVSGASARLARVQETPLKTPADAAASERLVGNQQACVAHGRRLRTRAPAGTSWRPPSATRPGMRFSPRS